METIIRVNKQEKEAVLKWFPKTNFIRTMRQKSKRHNYYMTAEKDQLRFLSGFNKTYKKNNEIHIIIPGSAEVNMDAVKEFEKLLLNNIQYYGGEIGGGAVGDVLSEEEVIRSNGIKRHCQFELTQLRKKYGTVLRGRVR